MQKDFTALSVEWINVSYLLGYICRCIHYLEQDTELDKEAYTRGTSVYLVDRCIPMLPERLSNGLCSLRPMEDKLCFQQSLNWIEKGKSIRRTTNQ
jgi:ribonuclease R